MRRKIISLLLITCMLAVSFIGCKNDNSKKISTSSKASISNSPSTVATKVNTTSTAGKETSTTGISTQTAGSATASPSVNNEKITDYSIELDFQIDIRNAGIAFGYIDSGNFCMWQLNNWYFEGAVYLRPHVWKDGAVTVVDNIDISNAIKYEDKDKKHSIKITVDSANEIKTYVNNILVDTRTEELGAFGSFGMRENINESAYFDNIVIKNTKTNKVLFQQNFDNNENPFAEGEIVNGKMNNTPSLHMTGLVGEGSDSCVIKIP